MRELKCHSQVYFSLRNDSDLVIRAKRKRMDTGYSEIIELIPQEKFDGDLPAVLIEGHAHWLSISTSIMEIRPLGTLWEASSENWKLDCTPGNYRIWKTHECLVDIRSKSWNMVSSLLRPLSPSQYLIVSASQVDSSKPASSLQLSVALPCHDLSFYIDEDGDLQCRNIRGMIYDEDQSTGTLFGLVNQLVLRPKMRDVGAVELIPRCVLIPNGDISFGMDGHHVRVEITPRHSLSIEGVTYQAYRVNTELGCLTGNGSLTSKLYCAYLHALTSGCSADPLTGRSGTEEALSGLRSASCWPMMRFGPRDAELLSLIASICPSRTWHSQQAMQKVDWRSLPAISQNHGLYVLAKAIKECYERVQLFNDGQASPLFNWFPLQDERLLKRGERRAVYLFPSDFSGRSSGANLDSQYCARDLVEVASGEHRASAVADTVYHRTATSTIDVCQMVQLWTKDVSGNTALSLRYDRSWLAPDLPLIWLATYNLLRKTDEKKWFQLLFSLPVMAFASPDLSELVPVFVAFASHSQFRFEDPPHYDSYPISKGCYPSAVTLRNYIVDCAHPLTNSPESLEPARYGESLYQLQQRQLQIYDGRRHSDANVIAQELLAAWPCETFPPCSLNPDLYNVMDLASKVQRHFSECFRNLKLNEHLTRVQRILNSLYFHDSRTPKSSPYSFRPSQSIPSCVSWPPVLDQLLARPAPLFRPHDKPPQFVDNVENTLLSDSTPLHQLITAVGANAVNLFQHRYVSSLRTSAEYFRSEMTLVAHPEVTQTKLLAAEALADHCARCRANYVEALHDLQRHLGPRNYSEHAVEQSGQWPCTTTHGLLRCLASTSPIALPDNWKKGLIAFSLLALELQRARRLLLLHLENLHEELSSELQNGGCDGWDATAHPDWLLIQVCSSCHLFTYLLSQVPLLYQLQGNFLIRRVQVEVANEMISPRSGDNTTMQLNMGEGKTSVIIPIVAAALANGNQLVRVIVPKPLTVQMLHLLADRLGGLTNRRIYHLPFSRSLEVNHEKASSLCGIMLECMRERGIMVLQPEHVLSQRLVSVEMQLSRAKDNRLADQLLELQRWLHSYSRDILDESDEILDPRCQLVFTIGRQQHIEGSPERWIIIEQILGVVAKHASSLRELFPHGVEYEPGPPGSFPYLRILQEGAAEMLVSWIVHDVMEGHLPNFSFGQLRSDLRDAVQHFISCEDAPLEKALQPVREYFERTPLWSGLLLLRGLLANGILMFAFRERRWRVDYGLFPTRTTLAVPYTAKDVPAPRAEFGHPDVAITLTCLSYYYDGLCEGQLKLSFGILFETHDPSFHYEPWVRGCSAVPESLRTLSGINIDSVEQWDKYLFPLFSRNRATIDFYLSNVVFPREAKEFPSKLSSSGWDLAEKKERLLTGKLRVRSLNRVACSFSTLH